MPVLNGLQSNNSLHQLTRLLPTERVSLDPETLPDEIAGQHAREVSHAVRRLNTLDVGVLSESLDLPPWNVRRALARLGLTDDLPHGPRDKAKRVLLLEKITALLGGGQQYSFGEIAKVLAVSQSHVSTTVRNNYSFGDRRFVRTEVAAAKFGGAPRVLWRLKADWRTEPTHGG